MPDFLLDDWLLNPTVAVFPEAVKAIWIYGNNSFHLKVGS